MNIITSITLISIFDNKLYYYELENTGEEYEYIARIVKYDLNTEKSYIIVQSDSISGFKYNIAGNMLYFMDENYEIENRIIYKYNLVTGENYAKAIFGHPDIENFTVVDGTVYITFYGDNSIYKLLGDQTAAPVQQCDSHPLNYIVNKGKIYFIQFDIPMGGYFRLADGSGNYPELSDYLSIDPQSYATAAASLLDVPAGYQEYAADGELKEFSYSWIYPPTTKWTFETSLSESLYDKYQKMSRDVGTLPGGLKDYSYFVMNPDDDYLMYKYTTYFKQAAEEKDFDRNELVEFITRFVQSIEYVSDQVGTGFDEYEKFPIETLYDQGGDCEDSSILLASFLKEMGVDCVMLILPGHMAVEVACDDLGDGYYYEYEGEKYYYVETTDSGWKIGEMPSELRNETAILIPLN